MNIARNKLALSMSIALGVGIVLSALFSAGFLESYNVRVADSLYGGKEPLSGIVIVAIDDRSLQEIGRWPWDRSVHAALLDKIGQYPLLTAFDVSFLEPSPDDALFAAAINNSNAVFLVSEYTEFSSGDDIYGTVLLKPVIDAPHSTGFANIFTDIDSVVRSIPTEIEGVETLKSLDVAIAETLGYGAPEGRMLINYAGPPNSFVYYSYSDVLNDRVSPEEFRDKIIFVGATAPDLRDTYVTPASSTQMPGVEIHANAVQTILTGQFLEYQNNASVILVILMLSFAAGLVMYRFHLIPATVISLALLVAYVIAVVLVFEAGVVMNILYPLLAVTLSYFAHVGVFYMAESKQRRLVTNIFGKYVSKEVAEEILREAESDELNLKGQKRDISVFFSDIRGFTTLSEKMTPEQLVEFLNNYLSAMTDVVLAHRGVVDKYIGDAIMAFWGAPLKESSHARLACEAALAMKRKLEELKIPNLAIGMGINTGPAIVGNMGSAQRVNYTAIGDVVNTASRLEGMTKEYGVHIIIGEPTHAQVMEDFVCRELDMIRVKGKNIPVRIYELVCMKGDADEKTLEWIKIFDGGLGLYRKGDWKKALEEFERAHELGGDKTSKMFEERCAELQRSPPADWDGVWTMTHK